MLQIRLVIRSAGLSEQRTHTARRRRTSINVTLRCSLRPVKCHYKRDNAPSSCVQAAHAAEVCRFHFANVLLHRRVPRLLTRASISKVAAKFSISSYRTQVYAIHGLLRALMVLCRCLTVSNSHTINDPRYKCRGWYFKSHERPLRWFFDHLIFITSLTAPLSFP